jgi:palmitoyltransferase
MVFKRSRVGGVVGETTFKFFIQFTSWAAVYCTFILVIMAIVTAEERKVVSLHPLLFVL